MCSVVVIVFLLQTVKIRVEYTPGKIPDARECIRDFFSDFFLHPGFLHPGFYLHPGFLHPGFFAPGIFPSEILHPGFVGWISKIPGADSKILGNRFEHF